ncbi:MAG: hypothetical protein KF774_10880 [Planctomyces sp.]|nr:hypothetical protein [Planctomyces sp.]
MSEQRTTALALSAVMLAGAAWVGAGAALEAAPPGVRSAMRNAVRKAIRQDQTRVNQQRKQFEKAAEDLQERQVELAEAQAAVESAKAELRAAAKARQAAIERETARLQKSLKMDQALADQQRIRGLYDEVSQPILAQLRESPEHIEAQGRADAAAARLREPSDSRTPDDRGADVSEAQRTAAIVAELERKALEADATVRVARQTLNAASGRVSQLRRDIRSRVDEQPSVQAASRRVAEARSAIEAAETQVAAIATGRTTTNASK